MKILTQIARLTLIKENFVIINFMKEIMENFLIETILIYRFYNIIRHNLDMNIYRY